MKLSIIVPFYNVERYVEKCINSCLNQDLSTEDYEIIIINDGSQDKSGEIVERIAKDNSNICYLTQENKGLSYTRNRGLSLAKGDVVWFVDSDDWIEGNCVASMLDAMQDADILICTRMIPEGIWNTSPYFIPDNVDDIKGWFMCNSPSPAQFYMFKRLFLLENNLKFVEGRKHEDALFTPIALMTAKSVRFYRNPVYHFNKHEGSITTTVDPRRTEDYKYVIEQLFSYYKYRCPVELKYGLANRIANCIVAHMQLTLSCGDNCRDEANSFYKSHPELLACLKHSIKKYTVALYYILKCSPFSYIRTYKILSKIRYS